MKRFVKSLMLLFSLYLVFASCSSTKRQPEKYWTKLISWNEKIRRYILLQSETSPDSVSIVKIDNNFIILEQHYSKGHIFLSKTFMIDNLLLSESRYSNDGAFELRQYFCQGKTLISESILYKGEVYGLVSNYYCPTSTIKEVGFRFKNIKYGIWKSYDSLGREDVLDLKRYDLVDSLDNIKFEFQ